MKTTFKWLLTCCIVFLLLTAVSAIASADNEPSQGQFIVRLIKGLGLSYMLPEKATVEDYIKLAQSEGFRLPNDFSPGKPITVAEKADLLDQMIKLEIRLKEEHRGPSEVYRNKAVIEKMIGTVMVKREAEDKWIPAAVDMKLTEGDFIKTTEGATVYLRVGIAGRIKIKENSELQLKILATEANKKSEKIVIYLAVGELLVDVRDIPEGSTFETYTPATIAAVRGTIYLIKVEPSSGKTVIREKEKQTP